MQVLSGNRSRSNGNGIRQREIGSDWDADSARTVLLHSFLALKVFWWMKPWLVTVDQYPRVLSYCRMVRDGRFAISTKRIHSRPISEVRCSSPPLILPSVVARRIC